MLMQAGRQMRISVLASGSSGNALLVSTFTTNVLVDAGVSAKRVAEALSFVGLDRRELDAVLVTHEHSDHVAGLRSLAGRLEIPVFATEGTHAAIHHLLDGRCDRVLLRAGTKFSLGDLTVSPFPVSHDCAEPVGYRIADGKCSVAIATDLGVVDDHVRGNLAGADCVVLESNHDERMLVDGGYPWPLKLRIMSDVGHLSNEAVSREVGALADGPLSVLVLAHLSNDNNTPRLAMESASTALAEAGRSDVRILVGKQGEVLGPVEIGGEAAQCELAARSKGAADSCTR